MVCVDLRFSCCVYDDDVCSKDGDGEGERWCVRVEMFHFRSSSASAVRAQTLSKTRRLSAVSLLLSAEEVKV